MEEANTNCITAKLKFSQYGPVSSHSRKDATGSDTDPYTWQEKFESFERINLIRVTNGNIDSSNSWKRLVRSHLHELLESHFLFATRIEFIRSKFTFFFCSCIRGHWAAWRTAALCSSDIPLSRQPGRVVVGVGRLVFWRGEGTGDDGWGAELCCTHWQ